MRKLRFVCGALLSLGAASAMATTYYVKPTGNDGSDGKTHGTAWKTVGKVNSFSFQPGDDVYFLSGSEWNAQLIVDWSGTETNRVVIGSYYFDGAEKIGAQSEALRPTLKGNYPLVNVTGALPGPYAGLIDVRANYVTVQNMRIYNSSGGGINLAKGFHHAIFEKNRVEKTAGSSMLFQRQTHDNVMRDNEMSHCAQGFFDKNWINTGWPICNGAVGSWNNLIENNYVHESWGEGIVAFDVTADKNVIRNNLLVWVRSANIYLDNGSYNLVENNIVIGNGGNSNKFSRSSSGYSGAAFSVSVEYYPNMDNSVGNVLRNNLVVGTQGCFNMGMEQGARDAGKLVGADFVGNTCVANWDGFSINPPDVNIEKVLIADNIVYDVDDGVNACYSATSSKITFQNNLWGVNQTDPDCRSSSDRIGDPRLTKTSGWREGGPDNIFEAVDFKPLAGSPVFGAGRAFSTLTMDYFGTKRPNLPAMGAIEANSPAPKIATPSGLQLTVTP